MDSSFGTLFKFTSWGESHGPAIGCVVDGCPPGIPITEAEIQGFLERRKPGQSRFTTQRREPDTVRILSGTFHDEAGRLVTDGCAGLVQALRRAVILCIEKITPRR